MKSWSLGLAVVLVLHAWVSPSCSWAEETAGTEEQEIRQLLTMGAGSRLKQAENVHKHGTAAPRSEMNKHRQEFKITMDTLDTKLRSLGCESQSLLQKIFGEDKGPGRLTLAYWRRTVILAVIADLNFNLNCPQSSLVEWLIGVARHSDNAYIRNEARMYAFGMAQDRDKGKIIPLFIAHLSDAEIGGYVPPSNAGGGSPAQEYPVCDGANAHLETYFLKHLWGMDCRNPRDRKKMQEVWQKYWEKNRGKLVWCNGQGRFIKKKKWNEDACGPQ